MKKLISLARKLSIKHFDKFAVDAERLRDQIATAITTAIANASTSKESGIWPFTKMQQEDGGVGLSFDVTRNGNEVTVTNVVTNPQVDVNRYGPLAGQIKKYLERNLELFPTMSNGDNVSYNNFKIHCSYPSAPTSGVAAN